MRSISAPAWTLWVSPPGGGEPGSPTSPLPCQPGANELNHLSHPSARRGRSDPRAGAALIPEFHVATCSAMSLAYKLETKQTHGDSNNLTRPRSPRNPGSGGEEKERCFRRYYIRGTRLHHPEKTVETGIEPGSGFTSIQKGRMYTFSQGRLAAGSDARPAKTRVNSVLASRDLRMAGNILLFPYNGSYK